MKRIAVVSLGYAWLPCEPGPSRLYYIANLFCEHGYEVEMITSGFQHFEKKERNKELIRAQGYPFSITFIDSPPYRKNIGLGRIYSNRISARRVKSYLQERKYDVVYCSIPANDVAAEVAKYCHLNQIPFIVDVEDLWPEAMAMVLKNALIQKILFPYFLRDAELVYRFADAVIGTSDEYTERSVRYQPRNLLRKTVYVGCDLSVFDSGIEAFSNEISKPENEFWVTYAGSIGTSYDIRTLVRAGKELKNRGFSHIRIKILGTGVHKEEMETLASELGCDNVSFLGYVEYKKMAAYLAKSDLLINSFVKDAPQSIVNKVGDYLAAGKPVLNTLQSKEFMKMVSDWNIETNIEPKYVDALTECIASYSMDVSRPLRQEQGENARKLAEQRFDRKKAYMEIVEVAENLLDRRGK